MQLGWEGVADTLSTLGTMGCVQASGSNADRRHRHSNANATPSTAKREPSQLRLLKLNAASIDAQTTHDADAAIVADDVAALEDILDAYPALPYKQPWYSRQTNSASGSALHRACELSRSALLQRLLFRGGADAAALVDEDEQTPLHVAVAHGAIECVLSLTSIEGASDCPELTASDRYKMTPLHLACEAGDTRMVELLLYCLTRRTRMSESALNKLRRGSASFVAKRHGHARVVQLLEKGALGKGSGKLDAELLESLSNLPLSPLRDSWSTTADSLALSMGGSNVSMPLPTIHSERGSMAPRAISFDGDDEEAEYARASGGSSNPLSRTPSVSFTVGDARGRADLQDVKEERV